MVELSRFRAERTPGDLRIVLFHGAFGLVERMDVQVFEVEPHPSQWRTFTARTPALGLCDSDGTMCVSARREDGGLVGLQGLLPSGRCFTNVRVVEARPGGSAELRGEGELLTCGLPAVFTEREHTLAGLVVPISGRGFRPFEAYELAVVRTSTADATVARTADAWRTPVVADGLGRISALHTLDETAGTYEVRVHAYRTDAPAGTDPEPLARAVLLGTPCGDGDDDSGEQCDDGNTNDGDGCDSNCQIEECGNGIPQFGEECDEAGNTFDCDEDCTIPECGDGVFNDQAETCDEGGNAFDCDEDCTIPECGDGVFNDQAETCDEGGNAFDCDEDCTIPECGDGVFNDQAETCDEGGNAFDCDEDCTIPECGDGVFNDQAETCDEGGNTFDCDEDCTIPECGDGVFNDQAETCDEGGNAFDCDEDCTIPECGDGVFNDQAETCDEGGESSYCNADCTVAQCGDGTVNTTAGEECEPLNKSASCGPSVAACDSDCTFAVCGDGLHNTEAGEQCDDGGTANGDGCDSNCQNETCGNNIVQDGEQCDDGNSNSHDSCVNCQNAFCGDGYIEGSDPVKAVAGGDECDDGDDSDGDGCSSSCTIEGGYECSGEPSSCADIDECNLDTDNCDANATCVNTDGSFVCACNAGYSGDGVTCTLIPTCTDGVQNQDETGIDCGGSTCAACAAPCPNLVQNGDFANGTSNWSKFFNTAGATFTVVGGMAQVYIATQTSNGQIYQNPLVLTPNTLYRVRFSASNDNGDNVTVQVIKNGAPYTKYASRVFDLTTGFDDFEFTFTSPAFPVNDGRLMFYFSPHDSNDTLYQFDNIVIELASCPLPSTDCGNGVVDAGETCDDGARINLDGCNSDCLDESCGDGIVNDNGAEECDDGSLNGINGLCSATCTNEPPSACPNLLQNGDFSNGTSNWAKFFNTAGATFTTVGEVAQVNIATQTTNGQIYQAPIALAAGSSYLVSFRARNTHGDNLTVKVIKNVSGFNVYWVEVFDLTDTFQEFSFVFTSPTPAINNGRLMFYFSPHDSNGTSYEIDDVVLQLQSCTP